MSGSERGADAPPVTELSALQLTRLLAQGQLTSADVMASFLDRIEAMNHRVNAIVSLRPREDLMAEAEAQDRAGLTGPLYGLPIAVKDLVATKGIRTTWGSPMFAEHVPEDDERIARRLKRAGAILIGKTNTPEFGAGSHTFNPVFGATTNPYDPARSAGGSSGGAAAALAMRLLPLADGSDMMGSLRNPAAFCNVYGFRPTWGLIPDDAEGDLFLHRLATDGPMARSPGDLALLLSALAGPDPKMPVQLPVPDLTPDPQGLQGARIGWLADWGGTLPFEDGILATLEGALRQMEDLGATVEPIAPPIDREAVWDSWTTLRSWAIAARFAEGWSDPDLRAAMKPEMTWEIERGRALTALDIDRASRTRSALWLAFAKLFETYDALAIPSAQLWPFPVGWRWPENIAGTGMDTYHRWMEVVIPVSLTGLPAVAIPAGFGSAGLPTGLTLFGPSGADARMLSLAESWHRATDWPSARPPLA